MNKLAHGVLGAFPMSVKRAIKRACYSGDQRYCPVCGWSARKFLQAGVDSRPNARCPNCNSYERHRLVWRYLQEKTDFFTKSGVKMLDIAPVAWFESRFRAIIGPGYVSADLMQPADVKMDVTDIQFPDGTFDIVYCSHVLEHVPDDQKAMREFHRILKPSGWAIFMVPITVAETVEDPTISDPKERLQLFGQDDHVRRYGKDFINRLEEAGFSVKGAAATDFLTSDEIERIAVGGPEAGEVFHCTKSAS